MTEEKEEALKVRETLSAADGSGRSGASQDAEPLMKTRLLSSLTQGVMQEVVLTYLLPASLIWDMESVVLPHSRRVPAMIIFSLTT